MAKEKNFAGLVKMEIKPTKPTLSEFIWEYVKNHVFCSRTIIASKYIDTFGIGTLELKREDKKATQKSIERKVASLFSVMKKLGIASRYSTRAMRINRAVFEAFTLQDVLNHNQRDCVSKKNISIDI